MSESEFCGCCGQSTVGDWCTRCEPHVAAEIFPWLATFKSQYGVPCPFRGGPDCPGPWVWYPCDGGAVLMCATCRDITVTGNWNDARHLETPILMEGLSS